MAIYRWYNEDKEREQRAIRDESRNIPLWEEYRKSNEKPVEVKSLWQAVKILWDL